jgi:VIT1/CCC1 family predicted Fe2+/Mn2+ transporter
VPLLVTMVALPKQVIPFVFTSSLICLAALGAVAAQIGGANVLKGTIRVIFLGTLAMAVTAGVGALAATIVK